jgi:hypothetical protein
MPKNIRNVQSRTPTPESVPSVNPEEMIFAIQVFQAALRLRMPVENPERKGIEFDGSEGARTMLDSLPVAVRNQFVVRENRLAPKDTAFHRGVGAVLQHYADHADREAIFQRVMAFYFLVNSRAGERLQQWQKPSEEDSEATMLDSAVMEAVAVAPVRDYGHFQEDEFFAVVEKISKKYSSD